MQSPSKPVTGAKYLALCASVFWRRMHQVQCVSRVAGKTYFAFASKLRPDQFHAGYAAYFVGDPDYIDAHGDHGRLEVIGGRL